MPSIQGTSRHVNSNTVALIIIDSTYIPNQCAHHFLEPPNTLRTATSFLFINKKLLFVTLS